MDFKQKVEIMRELLNSEEFTTKLKEIRKAVVNVYKDVSVHKYINYLFSSDKCNSDVLDDILSMQGFESKFGRFSTDVSYDEESQMKVIDCSWDLLLSDNPIEIIREYKRVKDEEMKSISKKYKYDKEMKERELYEKLKLKYER